MLTIPYTELSADALQGVIDSFVLREGTDYGHRDYSLEQKRERVLNMLVNGRAEICYYPENEHIDIRLLES